MSTNAAPVITTDTGPSPSLEQKIDNAALEAAQIASTFSPAIGAAIQAGVSVEPLISSLVHVFASLFKKHAKS